MSVAKTAYISKNGLVFIFFTSGSPAVFTNATAVSSNPSFYLNGSGSALANVQGPFWTDTTHHTPWVAYQLGTAGAPYAPLSTDTLTYSTSASWATTAAGAAPSVTLGAVTNYVGQLEGAVGYYSGMGLAGNQTLQVPGFNWTQRTFQLGMNAGLESNAAHTSNYSWAANWLKRNSWSNVATHDSNYHPLTISGASQNVPEAGGPAYDTVIDSRGSPVPVGVWTFVADDTAPATPMNVVISVSNGTITSSGSTPGTLVAGVQVGKTWWANIQYSATPPTTFEVSITVTVSGHGGTYPANWTLKNECMFAPLASGAAPPLTGYTNPVLPNATATAMVTTANGGGPCCMRWVDATWGGDGFSNVVDASDLRNATDAQWNPGQQSATATVVSVQAYSLTSYPNIFTSQPYYGTTAAAGGSPAAYQFTPANTYFTLALNALSPGNQWIGLVTTSAAHGFKTGQTITFQATPNLGGITVTNGASGNVTASLSNASAACWVTGATTFAVVWSSGNITT